MDDEPNAIDDAMRCAPFNGKTALVTGTKLTLGSNPLESMLLIVDSKELRKSSALDFFTHAFR